MQYPSIDQFIKNNFDVGDVTPNEAIDIVASCIDTIHDDSDVWSASDCTKKELVEWVGDLNTAQFKEVEKFFNTMPKLSHTMKVTNPKTKVESEVTLEGLASFFG